MKRSDIKIGDVLAYQRSTEHDTPQQAEVLDTEPWVALKAPAYVYRPVKPEVITLPDGSTVQAAARKPLYHDSASDKGVLVRLTRKAAPWENDQSDRVSVEVVRLATLRGYYGAVMARREAERAASQAAAAQAEARRQAARTELAALNERAQAVLNVQHTVLGTHQQEVTLSRQDFATLLSLAETSWSDRPVAASSVDHPQES